jgi:phage shock protein A
VPLNVHVRSLRRTVATSNSEAGVAVTEHPDYDEHGVPTLDYVRDKIEGRFATSLGSTELAEGSPQAQSLEEEQAQREEAAKAKLEQIRRSLERPQ